MKYKVKSRSAMTVVCAVALCFGTANSTELSDEGGNAPHHSFSARRKQRHRGPLHRH